MNLECPADQINLLSLSELDEVDRFGEWLAFKNTKKRSRHKGEISTSGIREKMRT
jgi:hypothetical protein